VDPLQPEGWEQTKNILVMLAHPDDPEFFCGGTLARWIENGHHVTYCLFTRGDKGGNEDLMDPVSISNHRVVEQRSAADVLGVGEVHFLNYPDGYLEATLDARKTAVREIRSVKPDIVVTCDPGNIFFRGNRLNHPDHLAAGRIVLEAIYPAAGNPLYFPELISGEGLQPHSIAEAWVSLPNEPNTVIDVTPQWEKKILALHEHKSQIGATDEFDARMRERRTEDSTPEHPHYEEKFRRILLG
jgi:LmbE family N-acetylglucosaminyl deacetylase